MNPLDEFRGLYPLSRTLKFRLIPRWETLERLQESDIIGEESRLRGHCDELKEAVDVLHRRLIEESLAGIDLDWQSLAEAAGGSSAEDSLPNSAGNAPAEKSERRRRTAAQFRQRIAERFVGHPDYKNLTAATPVKLMKEQLPAMLGSDSPILKAMKGKATSLSGYQTMRSHLYGAEALHGSVAYRVVDENFPIFLKIVKLYERVSGGEGAPSDSEDSFGRGLPIELLTVANYNKVLGYEGIAAVNSLCASLNSRLAAAHRRIRFPRLLNLPLSEVDASALVSRPDFVPGSVSSGSSVISSD